MDGAITCAGGCKRSIPPADSVFASRAEIDRALADAPDAASAAGWGQLPITNRWRCPHCTRELQLANALPGTPNPSAEVAP